MLSKAQIELRERARALAEKRIAARASVADRIEAYPWDNADALSRYALNWNRNMDMDIALVVDDDEAKALGRSLDSD